MAVWRKRAIRLAGLVALASVGCALGDLAIVKIERNEAPDAAPPVYDERGNRIDWGGIDWGAILSDPNGAATDGADRRDRPGAGPADRADQAEAWLVCGSVQTAQGGR